MRLRDYEQTLKNYHSSDCRLKFTYMKLESLVIVNQHVTVNMYLNFAQTARHVSEVGLRKKHNVIFYIKYI